MKIRNTPANVPLHNEIENLLAATRAERSFDPQRYVSQKINRLNEYMSTFNLSACVVAVSGGVDSAIVYAIINEARRKQGSPIKTVIPVSIPAYKSKGVTGQRDAYNRSVQLIQKYGRDVLLEIDISDVHEKLRILVENKVGITGDDWADGQLVPYLRTPTYYYINTLLASSGQPCITCGTTNMDEGAYLGYFGKASDGMVDLQLISDIHKSEVYSVAAYLGIPESILSVVPTGDMYDSRTDEEVFGAPYDFVEYYLYYLNKSCKEQLGIRRTFSSEALEQFVKLQNNLENLHAYNKHKYLGASPAIHLDLLDGKVRGGWDYNVWR